TLPGNGVYREPGEEGRINPMLAARVGMGGAGAAYGAATGDTTEDRVKRALLFGAAGAIAPSLIARGGGATVGAVAGGARRATEPDAVTGQRLFTPKAGAMPDAAIPSAQPMPAE